MVKGQLIADVVASIGTIDIVLGRSGQIEMMQLSPKLSAKFEQLQNSLSGQAQRTDSNDDVCAG